MRLTSLGVTTVHYFIIKYHFETIYLLGLRTKTLKIKLSIVNYLLKKQATSNLKKLQWIWNKMSINVSILEINLHTHMVLDSAAWIIVSFWGNS